MTRPMQPRRLAAFWSSKRACSFRLLSDTLQRTRHGRTHAQHQARRGASPPRAVGRGGVCACKTRKRAAAAGQGSAFSLEPGQGSAGRHVRRDGRGAVGADGVAVELELSQRAVGAPLECARNRHGAGVSEKVLAQRELAEEGAARRIVAEHAAALGADPVPRQHEAVQLAVGVVLQRPHDDEHAVVAEEVGAQVELVQRGADAEAGREPADLVRHQHVVVQVDHPHRARELRDRAQRRLAIAANLAAGEIEHLRLHAGRAVQPHAEGLHLGAYPDHVEPPRGPLPRRRPLEDCAVADGHRDVVLLDRQVRALQLDGVGLQQAEQRHLALQHALRERAQQRLPLPAAAEPRRGHVDVVLGDDALLRPVRLEEDGLQQRLALGGRHVSASEHGLRRHLVQLGRALRHAHAVPQLEDGDHHAQHERVRRDHSARLRVLGHVLQVALELSGRVLVHPMRDHLELLLEGQVREPKPMERLEVGVDDARRPRRGKDDVPLRLKHLRHVPLDLRPHPPALVEPVDEEHRAPREHRLAQEEVHLGLVLEAQEGVHPVPRARKGRLVLPQPQLQPLHTDHDRNQLNRGVQEAQHQLAHQQRLPRRRQSREQRRRSLYSLAVGGRAQGMQAAQPPGDVRGTLQVGLRVFEHDGNADAVLQHVEP
eukprot:7379827-Prymnesium_polylepis.1